MSLIRRAPRVLAPDAAPVPVRAPGYRPALAIALLIAVAAAFLGAALLLPAPLGLRLLLAGLGVIVLAALGVAVSWAGALRVGEVRVAPEAAGLRFSAPGSLIASMIVVALVGVLVAVLLVVIEAVGLPATSGSGPARFGPAVLGVAAGGWAVVLLVGLRVPPGLTLTPEGVRGVRGAGPVALAWDDLARVEVLASSHGARLVLHAVGGGVSSVDPHWTGSDPNLVAAIVEHFRARPADRAALRDGPAALDLVEDAVSRRA